MLGKARAVANRAFAETIPVETDGHGNGHHGNGHAVTGEEHEAVGAPGSTALPPGRVERNNASPVRGQAGSPFRVNDDSRFIARTSATTVTMAPMTTDVSTPRPASRAGSLARPLAMPRP